MEVVRVPVSEILADAVFNVRGVIDKMTCVELSKEIESRGLIYPITLRPINHDRYKYQIVAGHRRFTAVGLLGWETIPAFIDPSLVDEQKAKEFNLAENIHRSDLTITQEAGAVSYFRQQGYAIEQIAKKLNKSSTWVEIRRKLVAMPDYVQKAAEKGVVTQAHILQLWEYRNDPAKLSEVVRTIKMKAEAGEKAIHIDKELSVTELVKARRPKPGEIRDMCFELANLITNKLDQPEYLAHRLLAWTLGEISLIEAYAAIKRECERLSLPFEPRPDVAAVFRQYEK